MLMKDSILTQHHKIEASVNWMPCEAKRSFVFWVNQKLGDELFVPVCDEFVT